MTRPAGTSADSSTGVLSNGRDRSSGPRRGPRLPQGGGLVVVIIVVVAIVAATLDLTLSSHHSKGRATPAPAVASATPSPTATPASPSQLAAQNWQKAAERAEEPAGQAYISMVEQARNWQLKAGQKNKISAAGLRADLVNVLRSLGEAQHSLAVEKAYPPDPRALVDFRESVHLYSAAASLTAAATYTPPGALRQQVLLSVTRVRQLGDKVYDDANSTLKPLLPPPAATPGLHFDPESAVPIWSSIPASDHCITVGRCPSISAGPPLAPEVAVATAPKLPTTPQTQPIEAWLTATRGQALPSAATEAHAITGSSAVAAGNLSAALARAQSAIALIPDPTDPTVSATVQLSLLAHAEAARTAQEADVVTSRKASAALRAVAGALAGVGDALWDGDLGARSTRLH